MRFKYQVFSALKPIAKSYGVFKWLSLAQAVLTSVMPFIWQDIETAYWLLSLALLGFWLSTYAVLKMAHVHKPPQKGLAGWFNRMTENGIFLVWLVVFVFVLALIFKVAMLFR